MPHTSIEAHQQLRALEEDSARATSTTIADIRATRTKPPPCPTEYYSMLQMLCAYIKLLIMLFGPRCEHMAHVTTIFFLVKERMAMYERMTRNQVAHLLWAVFVDGRSYFSTPHDHMGNPPVSTLDWLIGAMRGGSLPEVLGTPIQSLFGGTATSAGNPYRIQGAPEAEGGLRYQREPQAPNPNVHVKIEAATAEARRLNPEVDFRLATAAANPKPRLSDLQLYRGGCFNYLFFGKCRNHRCSFAHDGQVSEAKVEGVINKMRPALAQFVAAAGHS
jgi:hypothetical protein